jgi:hypothetical protein
LIEKRNDVRAFRDYGDLSVTVHLDTGLYGLLDRGDRFHIDTIQVLLAESRGI